MVGAAALCGVVAGSETEHADGSPWHYQLYLDAGYLHSDNDPANEDWRSKSTTYRLDRPALFLAMGDVRKDPTPASRWGVELGLQTGLDSEGLVTAPPPPANAPIEDADAWRHLYRASASYLFDAGRGLRLTAGLLNGYIAYESYLAVQNPNYTRGYLTDLVPYFMIGVQAAWDVSEAVDLSFYLTSGYNYLTHPNDVPSPGLQLVWHVSPSTTFTQNLYYGPDQAQTSLDYWRFFSDSFVEWKLDSLTLAVAADFGTEKQAYLADQPRWKWASGAAWARWQFARHWSLGLRPEIYSDPDGLMTGAVQLIRACTGTVKYTFSSGPHRLVGTFEMRYDRSTGEQGGYYSGPDDRLVPGQTVALLSFLWSFDR